MSVNTWTGDLAAAYARHTGGLRGALRHALLTRGLLTHLPTSPQRLIDIGGGAGYQAIALARAGHHVTVLDPDPAMLERAATARAAEPAAVAARIDLHAGRGESAVERFGAGRFDAACCHGVLMYLDHPAPLLNTLVELVRTGGLVSVLAKNQSALAMRPGLEGRWGDAMAVIDTETETGNLGVASRADDLDTVQATLTEAGATTRQWYGVRVFTDHLGDAAVGPNFDEVLDAEWAAGSRDPYRRVARLFHLIAARDT